MSGGTVTQDKHAYRSTVDRVAHTGKNAGVNQAVS